MPISKHDHGGHMIWDDDFCACRVCDARWVLDLKKGWIPVDENENPIKEPFRPPTRAKVKIKTAFKPTRPTRVKVK
jgi:hypothetical protein